MRKLSSAAAIIILGLAACGSPDPSDEAGAEPVQPEAAASPQRTVAALRNAEGESVGTATATESGGAVAISLTVQGLSPGEHGVHVHQAGRCEGPKFESAGGHWNPGADQHGLDNPAGQHAGDMPNLTVGNDGTGSLEYTLEGASLSGLLDADGAAFVVHAGRDDQKTDPSGDSGDRIACGRFGAS